MPVSRRIAFAVSTSWLSRAVTIGLNLLLIPILFHHLGKEELGLWFMLGQSGAFLTLMDLGITPTLTRRIAFAAGKSGGDVGMGLSQESSEEIANLIASGRVIYRFLSVGVFLFAWATGLVFLQYLDFQTMSRLTIWIAWTILCLGHALGVWASLWGCLLQGVGYVGIDTLIWTFVHAISMAVQVAVVMMGGGLIELAVVVAISGLASRYLTLFIARRRRPELFTIKGHWDPERVRSMIKPALNSWSIGLGSFLILKTDQFFIAYFQGAGDIPAYHAAYQLVLTLSTLVVALAVASRVFISHLWEAGELKKLQKIVETNSLLGLSIMACGTACLLLVGEEIIELWLGSGQFIGYPILSVFCIMLVFQAQQNIIHSAARATEYEPFAAWALAAGILNVVLTLILIEPYGLLGVALGTMFATMLTTNWYVVMRGLSRLAIGHGHYALKVCVPAVFLFVSTWGIGRVAIDALPDQSHAWMRLLVAVLVAVTALVSAVWFSSLGQSVRLLFRPR